MSDPGDERAFPTTTTIIPPNDPTTWTQFSIPCTGLTKRELAAMCALHGHIASGFYEYGKPETQARAASLAVEAADALLAELGKPREGG